MNKDTKTFLIGLSASITAYIVWDLFKHKYYSIKSDIKENISNEKQ